MGDHPLQAEQAATLAAIDRRQATLTPITTDGDRILDLGLTTPTISLNGGCTHPDAAAPTAGATPTSPPTG